ncbi:diflavin flavoprotein [Chamaesiphon minutus]|uniref:Putative flavoprotein n=1 Tax=Chamaesiphon minutus (strain ATCC 27169 / PCC 6605) TaxID=1173020 RepID=K9U9R5_CHAP6|nr:diflavin flavoprotein [Chamaesiphon minutus]AFY91338.1 putative flavoprotein [Chamaesiphon minutus PCC 6605]
MTPTKPRDVQIAQIAPNTTVLRSRTWERLKFEIEYARQKGTTANSYLIEADSIALIDPPGESFTDIFLEELGQHAYYQRLKYIILSHINPNRIATLKRLLEAAPYATIICSKAGVNTLRSVLANQSFDLPSPREDEANDLGIEFGTNQTLKVHVVRDEETLDLGNGHVLQFRFVPTPRHPDALCTFDRGTGILYTDKLFGSHVCDDAVFDEHWKTLADDRKYYFDCLYAAQSTQVEAILTKIAEFPTRIYAPAHGSIVRHSRSVLTLDYQSWCEQQQKKDLSVALLYTSAYGNTATLARAIEKGITQSGVKVRSIDCEFTELEEITDAVQACDGFIIGSPTLAGHPPTQIQTALGIVLSTANQTKVAGVFGSYGWSGEAVDLIASKLQDVGYPQGFEPIRVKFAPTEETLEQCEAAGVEFAKVLNKAKKVRAPRQISVDGQTDRTGRAIGRVTGSLCVITANNGNKPVGLMSSRVSQAGFSPPAITIAVAKDRELECLANPGEKCVVNILKEGNTNLQRHFLKPPTPGTDRFADLETTLADNGCIVLTEALSYLECTVKNRMDCGDRWLLYAVVDNGKVLELTGVTAIDRRQASNQY